MDRISELKRILSGFCFWNKTRLDYFARMLVSLLSVRTVNLSEIAVRFESAAQIDSRYQRVKQFLAEFTFDRTQLAKWLFQLFFTQQQGYYVILDRTNWFWGKGKINILMLSVAYEGIAIRLHWKLLKKSGNASATEHIELIKEYLNHLVKPALLEF